jgi:curved DNA-binding protein
MALISALNMKFKDYYAVLGVPRDADVDQIKKAYRKLARQYHPDVSKEPNAEAQFKEAGEAYATLKDAEKRTAYDQLGKQPIGEEFSPPPQWRQEFGGGQRGGNGASFDDIDLSDLFAAMGRVLDGDPRSAQRESMPMNGRDYENTVHIKLEDAHRGTKMNLELADEKGSRTLEVTIPAGVRAGQKLRLRGKGGKGHKGGADGDIYLHIALLPHPIFRTDGHDLYFDLALTPWEAALGAEVQVQTLDEPVLLTVPAVTRAGRKLRLRGRGLSTGSKVIDGDEAARGRGDLYALARIDIPATLTDRERELYQELANLSHFNPRNDPSHNPRKNSSTPHKESTHGTTTS